LWVKLTSFHKGETFFAGYGNFGSSDQTFHLGTTTRTLFFSQWGQDLTGPDLESGRWYHVAVTNVGKLVTLYLDGQSVGQSELTIETPDDTQFFIGGLPADGSKRLEGLADEVAVYNRALTPEEKNRSTRRVKNSAAGSPSSRHCLTAFLCQACNLYI
jgi:hypothetical protein